MKKLIVVVLGCVVLNTLAYAASTSTTRTLLDEIATVDSVADEAINQITSQTELATCQSNWREAWLKGLGGLPTQTPLNAQEGPIISCEGFSFQNVLFESQPGVYVVGHLALPASSMFKPPYPIVLMPMGHSNDGIIYPPYATHLAMMAKAGFAAFSWDPISQGERRQSRPLFDYSSNCSTEHARLGARGWLVGWNFARFLIWDGIRALDYLATRCDVDCSAVGVCGTSGGGTQSAYLQAFDPRIKVAFPNCFISSVRAVFSERGCHDAEQFYWGQLLDGVNHAAILALGAPRVWLATGSRWQDYFPQAGAVATFAVYSNLVERIGGATPWHFHCAGSHGLSLPTRTAQVDWMLHCLRKGVAPKARAEYWALSRGDHAGANDPANAAPLPFPTNAAYFTSTHHVRDLSGFRSLYDLIAERAQKLESARRLKTPKALREVVRRRANIRPLALLRNDGLVRQLPFDHPKNSWWYLKGAFGTRRENEAAMLATLGRSVVGRDAENIIVVSAAKVMANGGRPIILKAKGWDCIAAAHAYAAEPELFSGIDFTNPPPSWTSLVTNPDPRNDSYAISVWGALEEYDWTELVPEIKKEGTIE